VNVKQGKKRLVIATIPAGDSCITSRNLKVGIEKKILSGMGDN
jgi:hypothetical protein